MKNNRPPILQSDWSIANRHGRIIIIITILTREGRQAWLVGRGTLIEESSRKGSVS